MSETTPKQKGFLLRESINNPEFGWNHSYVLGLAFDIVTDFGRILEETHWMIFGAPESLLLMPKGELKIAFEVLYKFLHNKDEWSNVQDKEPEIASAIIKNSFYKILVKVMPYVERFIPDEDAELCVEVARSMKDKESKNLYEALRTEDKIKTFFKIQEIIEENKRDWQNYLDSQVIYIKDNIFD